MAYRITNQMHLKATQFVSKNPNSTDQRNNERKASEIQKHSHKRTQDSKKAVSPPTTRTPKKEPLATVKLHTREIESKTQPSSIKIADKLITSPLARLLHSTNFLVRLERN
eukprot:Lithocolla_globosa_v1_NODE_136_length_5835_cov_11.826644.p8 type:complete len:111 gc:universal NODE_136_length_5835_cov_11.826644:775-443(-)